MPVRQLCFLSLCDDLVGLSGSTLFVSLPLGALFGSSTNARGSGAMENKRVIGLTFRLSSASLPYRIVGQSSAPDSTFSVPGNKKTNKNRKAKGLVRAFVLTRMSIAPRPMCSRVEIIPIDCLSLGVTPLIPEVTELSLSSLTKRDEVAMNQSTKPVT
ncbi:hypothetical protein COLO4_04168 [Corchorus olitorius]|uniref:Uncharacterized protein n=1 Tax=Corchorus olitorius TaxID=93759 RepID=A0A1R3KV12_9ROSI|nr:hypothetical protein COLO4_04168 [Corchorus olitorius]